jgi:hypothetical protein
MNSTENRQYEKTITIGNMRKIDKFVWPTTFASDNNTNQCRAFRVWKALLFRWLDRPPAFRSNDSRSILLASC